MSLSSLLVVALVAAAAAAGRESSGDYGGLGLMYPEQSLMDELPDAAPAPRTADPAPRAEAPRRRATGGPRPRRPVLLRVLPIVTQLGRGAPHVSLLDRSWLPSSSAAIQVPPEAAEFTLAPPGAALKRQASGGAGARPLASGRVLQQWKIKKGKSATPMVCYFKICAFIPAF